MEKRVHLEWLDGLRGVLACYVVLYHALLLSWPAFSGPRPPLVLWPLLWGRLAVVAFIVVSGFCLTLPISKGAVVRGGWWGFVKRRAWRIIPTFYAAFALSLLVRTAWIGTESIGRHSDCELPISKQAILSNALLLQDIWQPYRINGVFWSVALEWKIYLLFPLLAFISRRFGWTRTLVASLIGSHAAWLILQQLQVDIAVNYIGLFVAGMLAAVVARSEREMPSMLMTMASTAAAACTVILLLTMGFGRVSRWPAIVELPAGFFVAFALIHLSTASTSLARSMLTLRPLVWVGGFAYSIYLIHFPSQQLLAKHLIWPRHLSPMYEFLATASLLPIIIVVAWLFFLIAERPVLRWKPWSDTRQTASSSSAHAAP